MRQKKARICPRSTALRNLDLDLLFLPNLY